MISKAATNGKAKAGTQAPSVRCAIYSRQSVSDSREEYSSLDAQREAAEAYVTSQRARGWTALPTRYDDAGLSGATADRPALQRLLADIEAGAIDCVLVYKIDRLSRSITDFVRLMDDFERHGVAFAAVTQQFDTTSSVGRLTLNLLTCFAQFERETIAERTRDKIHAARRRGRWTGGPPPLGYDVAPEGGRILVNVAEAKRVRAMFDLYLKTGTLTRTVQALNERGWTTKAWTTREGKCHEGARWTKQTLRRLLSNPLYVGRMHLADETFDGEHPALIGADVFEAAAKLIAENATRTTPAGGRRGTALLSGLLRCGPCAEAMTPTHTRSRGREYRYYTCRRTRTEGWAACPSPSVPAHEIEALVVDQIRAIGRDKALQDRVLDAVREEDHAVDPAALRRALALFDPVWDALHAPERSRILNLLLERVAYDGAAGTLSLAFRGGGIEALAREVAP